MTSFNLFYQAYREFFGMIRHAYNQRRMASMHHWVQYRGERLRLLSSVELKNRTLGFIESMRIKPESFEFRYGPSQKEPVLYASLYAILTRSLYRDLPFPDSREAQGWAAYINSFQCEDGLFRDPAIAGDKAEHLDYWGWRHMTLHALMALTALGAKPLRRICYVDRYLDKKELEMWLTTRDWNKNHTAVSNAVQNLVTFLQYERDFFQTPEADYAVKYLFEWLLSRQNPHSGSWGEFKPSVWLPYRNSWSAAVHTGYHIWLPMWYDGISIPNSSTIIFSLLKTQNRVGGFGNNPNSTACDDIDSIDPMVRLYPIAKQQQHLIKVSISRALSFVLANFNIDGGAVFLRDKPFAYFHCKMATGSNESAMFPTWFRTLSLAFLAQILTNEFCLQQDWAFLDCPGHQFFRPAKK